MFLQRFERDELPAGREPAGEPDGAIAAERADLEDAPGVDEPREDPQEFAVCRGDVDLRQAGGVARLERSFERRVRLDQRFGNVAVDLAPDPARHQAGTGTVRNVASNRLRSSS